MLTYQRSKIWSPQSCSQSAEPDEGSLLPLLSADHEQLWLTYNALQRTQPSRSGCKSMRPGGRLAELKSLGASSRLV